MDVDRSLDFAFFYFDHDVSYNFHNCSVTRAGMHVTKDSPSL